jgi:hypothetical protein
MAFKKKLAPAARATSVLKTIASAQEGAMQAFSSWGKATEKAVIASERNLALASRKAGRMKARAANALKRMQRAKAKQVKAVAGDARKLVQTELASARATLKTARESHAAAKAAHKLYRLVEQGMASGVQAAEKLAAKAGQPKKLRRRLRKLIS